MDEGRGYVAANEAAGGVEKRGPSPQISPRDFREALGDVVEDVAAAAEGERVPPRRRRSRDGRGVFVSAGESARTAVGDGFPEKTVGAGEAGATTADKATAAEGTSLSADKATRTSVGDVVADDTSDERGSKARCPADVATGWPRGSSPPQLLGMSSRTRPWRGERREWVPPPRKSLVDGGGGLRLLGQVYAEGSGGRLP